MPGYAVDHTYNYVALAFWTSGAGPVDLARIWAFPVQTVGG